MKKAMTFNLRTDTKNDGINCFSGRAELVKACIDNEAPSIIGFQEAVEASRTFLKKALKDYVFLGCGRNEMYNGEGVSIAYDMDVFELLTYETFWLSENPSKPKSRFSTDQSECPRITIAAKLIDKEGKVLNFYNTHLDHKGEMAKLCGAVQIVSHMSNFCKEGEAIILTGDMNALPEDAAIKVFENAGLCDAAENVGGTFHNYGRYTPSLSADGTDKTVKIDYIFTNMPNGEKKPYAVKNYEKDGLFISDHYPVCAFIDF